MTGGGAAVGDELRMVRTHHRTTVDDWVILATKLPDRAFRVYSILRMHCQEGSKAWPGQKTIAEMLGIKKTDPVGAAIDTLRGFGILRVEVERHRGGRRNIYYLYEDPPAGYSGPVSRAEFYQRRGVTPETGVTPTSGDTPGIREGGDPRNRGDGSPPKQGSEVLQVEVTKGSKPKDAEADASDTNADASCRAAEADGATTDAAEDHGRGGSEDPNRQEETGAELPTDTLFPSWPGLDQPPTNGNGRTSRSANGVREKPARRRKRDDLTDDQSRAVAHIVGAWVDTWRETHAGAQPTASKRGQAGREIRELIAVGNDPARVFTAAESAARNGYATIELELARLANGNGHRNGRTNYVPYRDTEDESGYERPFS